MNLTGFNKIATKKRNVDSKKPMIKAMMPPPILGPR
jgi:hypothetical protein